MPYENQVWRLMKRPVGDIADGDLVYGKEPVPDWTCPVSVDGFWVRK